MKKTKLLIDNSITGGRGMAKQAYELIQECKARGVDYLLCTDEGFAYKLRDMGVEPDIVVPTALNQPPQKVNDAFADALEGIEFEYLVKIGARMAGPRVAFKRKIPYLLIDAGLPDRLEERDDGFYPKAVVLGAKKYFLTTQFMWNPPSRFPALAPRVAVTTYPLSSETKEKLDSIRNATDQEIQNRVGTFVPEVLADSYDASVALIITGSYVSELADRITYGGWLSARQYDQVVGFLRRFITDIGEASDKKLLIYMDKDLLSMVKDLQERYKGTLTLCTSRSTSWSYEEEFLVQRWADVLVSRAANYQPYMAYMRRGGIVTTPVPSDGYMDEDDAAWQSAEQGLTELIPYDDEQYARRFLKFLEDKEQRFQIARNVDEMQKKMFREKDCLKLFFAELGL